MLIQEEMDIREKLQILSDAAKYDVSCSSSGVVRKGKKGTIGNTLAAGICHSFAADGRCISLLKILYTNQCIYDCRYCVNRRSNDVVRTSFTPKEVCTLTIEFYRRNYIEGLFLSSGILYSPDYTMEQIYQTLVLLRNEYRFNGYIHVKAIPGADPELIERVGFLTDRMSVNLELPTAEGLKKLAPGKTREKILMPMRQVQRGIAAQNLRALEDSRDGRNRLPKRLSDFKKSADLSGNSWWDHQHQGKGTDDRNLQLLKMEKRSLGPGKKIGMADTLEHPGRNVWAPLQSENRRFFVPAGQSTQMIVGATPESDYHMIRVAEALYKNYDLKRVFYSAFVRVNDDSLLPVLPGGPPLLREHRLYQADWLLRFYGFEAEELLSEDRPNFNILLDPKCDWALRHLELFPVEVNRADYGTLLRVPGLGVKSARRILAARRSAVLDFPDLKKMGVVLKRAMYFLTCSGKMMIPVQMNENFITSQLISVDHKKAWDIENHDSYRQLSLFDDYQVTASVSGEDMDSVVTGVL
ncbi:MAG: putative DNA modification/repair radical SAM protein [Lachnospiraceae bacterium]|jgi:putative DNA modification/repair radical SAM protein|nr:putative DNA modification/repair radical SAM protein [Lachnospiraceae bacterium]